MIGHKLGEFSNKKMGPKIMIHPEIEKEEKKINIKNNGSLVNANFFRLGVKKNGFFLC